LGTAIDRNTGEQRVARVQVAADFVKKRLSRSRNITPTQALTSITARPRNGEDGCQIVEGLFRQAHFPPVHAHRGAAQLHDDAMGRQDWRAT